MENPRVRVFKHKSTETLVSVSLEFLRVDFNDLLSTVGLRTQLESCPIMNIVRPFKVSAALSQWNDLWKEFCENKSVLATRTCTGNCMMKENDFEKVPN